MNVIANIVDIFMKHSISLSDEKVEINTITMATTNDVEEWIIL